MKEIISNSTDKTFNDLDRHFARFIAHLAGNWDDELMLAALLISNRSGRGDICLNIPEIAGMTAAHLYGDYGHPIIFPKQQSWLKKLRSCPVVGRPGDYKPLILDEQGRLYLFRYWEYEQLLAQNIRERIVLNQSDVDFNLLEDGLNRMFPIAAGGEINWQRIAAFASVVKRFCVISGGPGTGKTLTVIRILVLLLEQALARGDARTVALAAPTGKAAARLKESMMKTMQSLVCRPEIISLIPDEAFTIHRLLGSKEGSPYFRYNKDNQLPYGMVIVDESSMADLALMAKLFQATSIESHLILLGDRDQLASVESGAVLGDICDTGTEHGYSEAFIDQVMQGTGEIIGPAGIEPRIADSIFMLHKSYRFGSSSGIGAVSQAVRAGDADTVLELLQSSQYGDISYVNLRQGSPITDTLAQAVIDGFKPYLQADTPAEVFSMFYRFSILCVLRQGPYGVETINGVIETILKKQGLIHPVTRWYQGRPVMVTRNDYVIRLFNGDVGIIFPDPDDKTVQSVYFPSVAGTFRKILPLQLPAHETAYAITVHKSQGSEFDRVLVLLPERESPVLSRELLYTAITRARKRVEIWGTDKILRFMINHPTRRTSGLRDALWG